MRVSKSKGLILLIFLLFPFLSAGQNYYLIGGNPGCFAEYGVEGNTIENAVAPAGVSEANSTTGWTNSGLLTFDAGGTPYSGDYAISAVSDSPNDSAYYDLSGLGLSTSVLYRIEYYVRHNGSGNNMMILTSNGDPTISVGIREMVYPADTTYRKVTNYSFFNILQDNIVIKEYGTDTGGIFIDSLSIKEASICFGDDLHSLPNAASLNGEANSTTGWNAINSLSSFTSVATPADGSYALRADATTSPVADNGINVDLGSSPFSLQAGDKYLVSFKIRHIGSGDGWYFGFSSTSTGTRNILLASGVVSGINTSYIHIGWVITYSSDYRFFVCHEAGTSNNGGIIIDSFVVKHIETE